VAVSVRLNGAPRNLANAFEVPVRVHRDESLTKKSAEKLVEKAKALKDAFGGDGKTFVLNLIGAEVTGFGEKAENLKDLLDKSLAAMKE
jgi:CRISPR system Cascade subunit CasC